jgi:S1-C subfamily serine protease
VAVVAALSLAAGCADSGAAARESPTTRSSSTVDVASVGAGLQEQYVSAVKTVRPSVVEISTGNALGSGIVFDDQGDIVTNAHVVADGNDFQVTLPDGTTRPADLAGVFTPEDLAVVRLRDRSGLVPATFADSSKLQVGDIVMAVGNPLGLASSVTAGIVSFAGRTVAEGNGVVLPDTVQTSASINPGNSGGALVDLEGEVVGIPTLAATDPQLGGTAPGIGFAIASNRVTLIARQLA